MRLAGHAELRAEARANARGRIQGDVRLALPSGSLQLAEITLPQRLDFSGATLGAQLGAQGGQAQLKVPLRGLGSLDADLALPGLDPLHLEPAKQPLTGHIQAHLPDLGFVSALTPHLAKVQGRLDLDYRLQGRLAAPRVQGRTALEGGALDVPALGLAIREIGLQVDAPDLDRLRYQGSARSGEGQLRLDGETRLDPKAGFPTELKVEGDNWLAVDIPEAEVRVSPRLTLRHQGARTDLEGEIHIPFGRIRPRALPTSAVTGSSDLVLVGGAHHSQKPPPPLDLHAKLRIRFGDKVNFEGFGLRAYLSGNLLVIDEPGRPVIGRGRVGIRDGTYRAYGQDLQIKRGYALFADTPVDNPGLDVQAVRVVDTITAGLRVSGTLKKPNLTLFSSPTLTQSDILSYIISGRPVGQGGAGRAGLTSALAAGGAGKVTDEIARQLGLDELRMETGGNLNEASVVAGTYLSPRLYVQYVNTLASRETSLRFRYDLTDKLQLQTETGNAQGVDLFYTIER
jgi:translocation and assembly module TamB